MAKKNLLASPHHSSEIFTELVRQDTERITNVEELEDFLRQFQRQLGGFHNTVYTLFLDYLNLLCTPEINDLLDPEQKALRPRSHLHLPT